MNFHDEVPIELAHLLERDIAQDSSVVDNDVNGTEVVDSSLDDFLTELDRVLVGAGNATSSDDLINDDIGGVLLSSLVLSLDRTTKIVDNNLAASLGEHKSVLAAETVASASNNCDLSVVANITHLWLRFLF